MSSCCLASLWFVVDLLGAAAECSSGAGVSRPPKPCDEDWWHHLHHQSEQGCCPLVDDVDGAAILTVWRLMDLS
jgi:hypothetical protein